MSQKDSSRIDHDIADAPSTYRERQVDSILDEIDEEETGQGFSEVTRTGSFVTKITTWSTPAKILKRTETDFTRVGAFLSSIVKKYFDTSTGLTQVASVSAAITRNANNTVKDVTVARSRP